MHTRQSAVVEKDIEAYLVSQARAAGGVAEKTVSPGVRGYFDRVVVLPDPQGGRARVVFVEVKKPTGSRTPLQQRRRHQIYRRVGAEVAVIKTRADVDRLIIGGVQKSGADLSKTQSTLPPRP